MSKLRLSPEMQAIEDRYQRPIRDVLTDTYNRAGSIRAAAEELQVNHRTLFGWMQRLRIEIQRVAQVA